MIRTAERPRKRLRRLLQVLRARVLGWGAAGNVAPISGSVTLFLPKFSAGDVAWMVSSVRQRVSPGRIWILWDGYVELPRDMEDVIDCRSGDTVLVETVKREDVFVYACDSDEIGLPWIRAIVKAGGRFYPVAAYRPSTYANVNDRARRTLEAEWKLQREERFDKWDFGPSDFLNIVQAIDLTARAPGAYVEVGCFRGSSASVAMHYMRDKGLRRECHFFDTFDGFNYAVARSSADSAWEGTHETEGRNVVARRIERWADSESGLVVDVRRLNILEDELPESITQVAVANIDVDLYEAVRAALWKIAPRVVPGGVVIVEDPGHTPALIGSRLALQEFLESAEAAAFTPIYMESGQTFLLRR